MCVYRKVEASKLKLPVLFEKRNWNFAFAFEHLWHDFELLNLLPFKIASRNSWETTVKCLVTMPLWQSNNLWIILCHQSFLLHCLSLTCWKLISFLESIFSYSFGNKAFHYFSQFKCCVKRGSNYFYGRVYSATKFFHGIVIAGVILPRDEI